MHYGDFSIPVLLVVSLTVYHGALYCGFVFDDVSAIKENKDIRPNSPIWNLLYNDFWGTPMHLERSHKSYRPLTVLTFRFNYWFGQLDPFGYHLVNVLLHAAVTVQFYVLCRCTLECGEVTSFSSALLFAVHPVHVEAVTGVVGRAELLSASLALSAFMVYAKLIRRSQGFCLHGCVVALLLISGATFCKEQGITVAAVCVLYDIFIVQKMVLSDVIALTRLLTTFRLSIITVKHRNMVVRSLFMAVCTLAIVILRVGAMGRQLPVFTVFDNPATNQTSPYRQLTYNYLAAVNMWLLICPAYLCCDWTMGTLPVIKSFLDYRNLYTILLYYTVYRLAKYTITRRNTLSDQIFMALVLIFLPFIPASNFFFPVGFVIAERVLYMPSLGYCLLIGSLLNELCLNYQHRNVYRHVAVCSFIFLLISSALRTSVRNKDWKDEHTLFSSALRFTQDNAKVWNNVGHSLETEGRYEEALYYFNTAARVQPDDIGSHINVGRTLKQLGDFSGAEEALSNACNLMPAVKKGQSYSARIAPSHLNLFITLGTLISMNESRYLEAESVYKKAISMRPDFIEAYMNYGDLMMRMGRTSDASDLYYRALLHDPNNADVFYNLGVVTLQNKHLQLAMEHFNKALDINPEHQQALYNSALLIQESGQPQLYGEGLRRLKLLMQLEQAEPKTYFTAAVLATDNKQFSLAEKYFKRSLEIDPNFKGALFNLALLLVNDLNKPEESVPYLNRNLKLHPDHVKSYLLLGDVAINNLKDLDLAEQCFKTIIELDPSNTQGRHNLCVAHLERGNLARAERCLVEVLQDAPNEDYIHQHLAIVRKRLAAAQQP